MPDRMSEDMPYSAEDIPDRMSEDMPYSAEDIPDRMSEDMPDSNHTENISPFGLG